VPYTLMHISDLHAGPPFNPHIAELVARQAHQVRPDLLVVSGDLVQRSDFTAQWRMITGYLATLPQPQLIVPGNHDVPLYNVFARVFRPLGRYCHFITPDLTPVFARPGLRVVGGCTAHGLTTDGGRVSSRQLAMLEQAFAQCPPETCKVAVLHHHVIAPPGSKGRRRMANADQVMYLLDRWGVELLLCGHIHMSYIGNTLDGMPHLRQGTIICQCGTTTSRRGKGREHGKNSFNVIEIDPCVIRIIQHLYVADIHRFVPVAEHLFPRCSSAQTCESLPSERMLEADQPL